MYKLLITTYKTTNGIAINTQVVEFTSYNLAEEACYALEVGSLDGYLTRRVDRLYKST